MFTQFISSLHFYWGFFCKFASLRSLISLGLCIIFLHYKIQTTICISIQGFLNCVITSPVGTCIFKSVTSFFKHTLCLKKSTSPLWGHSCFIGISTCTLSKGFCITCFHSLTEEKLPCTSLVLLPSASTLSFSLRIAITILG